MRNWYLSKWRESQLKNWDRQDTGLNLDRQDRRSTEKKNVTLADRYPFVWVNFRRVEQ